MDKIQFKLGEYVDDAYRTLHADVYINDQRLIDLVCQAENRHCKQRESTDFCGYIGLHITDNPFHKDAFPGILPDPMGRSEYWGTILTCTCGIDLCSSIAARIEILGVFIVWYEVLNPWLGPLTVELKDDKEFENYIPVDYSAIGPYVFRRKQYVHAWYAFKEWVMDWRRWNKFSVYRG